MPRKAAKWHILSIISKQILIAICKEIAQDVKLSWDHNHNYCCLRTGMTPDADTTHNDECGSLFFFFLQVLDLWISVPEIGVSCMQLSLGY